MNYVLNDRHKEGNDARHAMIVLRLIVLHDNEQYLEYMCTLCTETTN